MVSSTCYILLEKPKLYLVGEAVEQFACIVSIKYDTVLISINTNMKQNIPNTSKHKE